MLGVDATEPRYVRRGPEGGPYACPCCRFITLGERGMYQICPVCFWEDDGADDRSADEVGGPNGSLTLRQAREKFARLGACDESAVRRVRGPLDSEQPGRRRA